MTGGDVGDFVGHHAGEFRRGAYAAEESREGALQACVLIEEQADEAAAAEDLQRLGEALLPREQAQAEPFPRRLDEAIQGRVVQRPDQDLPL